MCTCVCVYIYIYIYICLISSIITIIIINDESLSRRILGKSIYHTVTTLHYAMLRYAMLCYAMLYAQSTY